jgi:hypothetical protein
MRKLRIYYSPHSSVVSHPADRRRTLFWAKERGHIITYDVNSTYDVAVLSGRANFGMVPKLRDRSRVVLDLVDGYLGKENIYVDWMRGISKVVTRQISTSPKPYRKILKEACELADGILCETPEQREVIFEVNKNAFDILDSHEEFMFNSPKTEHEGNSIFWEGLPYTIGGLRLLTLALDSLNKTDVSLQVLTDLQYFKFLGNYVKGDTQKLLDKTLGKSAINTQLIPWSLENVQKSVLKSKFAVLPLDPEGPLNILKAENRLLIMWRLGLPVLTSPSLAYSRVMGSLGLNGICDNSSIWTLKIDEFLSSTSTLKENVLKGQQYLRDTHSKELLLTKWDSAFERVMT